jgi:transposase
MTIIPEDLVTFLNESRDAREYRRAIAVKLAIQGYLYEFIGDMLQVSPSFVSKAKQAYDANGIAGLQLRYQGSQPYLSVEQQQALIQWLKSQQEWSIERLSDYIETTFGIVFQSRQSYYQLLKDAEISYKKAQTIHPESDPDRVAAKKKRYRTS